MKATELARRLKEISGAATNESAIEEIEALVARTRSAPPPVGVLLVINSDSEEVFPTLFGFNGPLRSADLELIKGAMLAYVNGHLERVIDALRKAELRAEVEAEVRGEKGMGSAGPGE